MEHQLFLVRHGETEWSRTGQHTGRTDIPLTTEGARRAAAIGSALRGRALTIWTSPMQRARETCRLAGLPLPPNSDADLSEWDYGQYEGLTTAQIREREPGWSIWHSPVPGGESLEQVAVRAGRVLDRASEVPGDLCVFSHGHFLRVLAACWIGQPAATARYLALDTASISILGYERDTRVLRQWNYVPQ